MPTYLTNSKTICLIKTANGYFVAPRPDATPDQLLFVPTLAEVATLLEREWTA